MGQDHALRNLATVMRHVEHIRRLLFWDEVDEFTTAAGATGDKRATKDCWSRRGFATPTDLEAAVAFVVSSADVIPDAHHARASGQLGKSPRVVGECMLQ